MQREKLHDAITLFLINKGLKKHKLSDTGKEKIDTLRRPKTERGPSSPSLTASGHSDAGI